METKKLNYTAEEINALLEKIENLQPVELPQNRFVYQTENTFNPVAGDFIIGIYSQGTSTINLKASDYLDPHNRISKVVVPGPTTKVTINTDNGISALTTDFANEPSDLGGGTQDRIMYTITAFATSNNPTSSQIWFFVDAEIYRLRV